MTSTKPKRPAPPPPNPTDPKVLKTYFDRVDSNSNGSICAEELKAALTNGIEDYPFQLSTAKAMMQSFKLENNQEIDFDTFGHIWRYVMDWQRCFRSFDADKSGSIDAGELHQALTSFGYCLSKDLTGIFVKRFDRTGKNEILFDDFIRCCLILYRLTESFQAKDERQNGKIEIGFEEFLQLVFSCGPLFC